MAVPLAKSFMPAKGVPVRRLNDRLQWWQKKLMLFAFS